MTDSSPPTLSSSLPVSLNVTQSSNLEITFNENILLGTGKIFLTDGVNMTFRDRATGSYATRLVGATETRELNASELSVVGNKLIINPATDLELDKIYHIYMEGAAITDLTGNVFTGMRTTAGTNFTTPFDVSAPRLLSMSLDKPQIESGGIAPTLTLIFDEAVNDLSLSNFTVGSGTLSNLAQSADGRIWTATLDTTYAESLSGSIAFVNNDVRDSHGNSRHIAETIEFGATTALHITLDWGGDTGIDSDDLVTRETVQDILVEPHMSVNEDDQMQLWVNGSWHTVSWVEEEGFNGFRLSDIELSGTGAIKARLLDQYGNERASTERTYVIDTEAPSYSAVDATVTLPLDSDTGQTGDSTTQYLQPYLDINLGTTTGLKVGDVVSLVEVWGYEFVNEDYPVVSHRLTAADIAAGTVRVQYPAFSEAPEGDFGVHLKVMVMDVAGNHQEEGWYSNQTLELNFDITPAHYDSMWVSEDLTKLYLQFDENVDPGNFRLVKDSDGSETVLTPAGNYSLDTETHVLTITLPSALAAGAAYHLESLGYVYDFAGNITPWPSLGFNATPSDTTPPPAPLGAPVLAPGSDSGETDGITNTTTLSVTAMVGGLTGVEVGDRVEVLDASNNVLGYHVFDSGDFEYGALSGNEVIALDPLTDGVHALHTRLVDAAGNVSTDSSTMSVTIDTSVPLVGAAPDLLAEDDSGISDNDNITNDNNVTVRVSLAGITGFQIGDVIELVNGNGAAIASHTVVSGDFSGGIVADQDFSLTLGAYEQLAVRVRDVAGNVSTAGAQLTVIADTTAPTAYLDTASFAFNSSTHIASINLTGDTADTRVEFSQNGGASWFQGTGSGANWTYDTGGAMSVLTMRVVDVAGNVGGAIPSLSAEPDTMVHFASDWNEVISTETYAALFTRGGDDVISSSVGSFAYLDGGSGVDTLNLTSAVTVVAANMANTMVNVEKIQLSGGVGNVLDVSDLSAVQSFGMSTLYIEGASGRLDVGTASVWTHGLDNGGYETYTAGGVTLMVANTITVVGTAIETS